MFESETTHLHPSLKECLACKEKLKDWYRRERSIKSLSGLIHLVSHVYGCQNEHCGNYRQGIHPEQESLLAIKGYRFGLDVILEIGQLRFTSHNTWEEIQQYLQNKFQLKICEREVGYLEQAYLALTQIVAKEDQQILKELEKLTGLILAIDGIKPDASNDVLYLIREIQTGQILAAEIVSQNVSKHLQKLLQDIIDLGYPILGVVSDKEPAIVTAVEAKLNGIPHQLCHYHYLKNLALPMIEADGKLKKKFLRG